jgi:putative two-component system response regulator
MDADKPTTVLIVDDDADNLLVLSQVLQPHYRVQAARSGELALQLAARAPRPDLVLLDVMMPGLDGYAVIDRLRNNPRTCDLPVIFVTALGEAADEERGLKLGANDYITKPIRPAVVLARVRSQLEAKQARDWLADRNAALEAEVARRMAENNLTQRVSIRALAHLAEARDPDTGNHVLRTQAYVRRLALALRGQPGYSQMDDERYVELLTMSAPLHDIGKVAIPDTVLLKPGRLDEAEMAIMRTHAARGAEAIEQAEHDVQTPIAFLAVAKEIARWHHERWDGTGYPDGLAGGAIPASARLMALADVFDALTTRRPYKAAMEPEQARTLIEDGRGSHFDPAVVDAFLANFDDFVAIARRYRESG